MTESKSSQTRKSNASKLRTGRGRALGFAAPLAMVAAVIAVMAGATLLGGQAALAQSQTSNINGCNTNDSTAPCFANNPDILGGRRHLLRNDDLVLSVDIETGGGTMSTIRNYYLPTMDSGVIVSPSLDVDTVPCVVRPPVPAPVSTRLGRLFNLMSDNNPKDAVVTLAPKPGASGTNCEDGRAELVFYNIVEAIESDLKWRRFSTGLGYQPGFTRIAIDDFDFDTFDEVFVIGPIPSGPFNPILELYEAVDVDDIFQGLRAKNSLIPANQNSTMPRSEPVIGDLNGDGILDVAWIGGADGGDLEIFIASICPNDQVTVVGAACETLKPVLSPISIPTGLKWEQLSNGAFPEVALVAGDFDGTLNGDNGQSDTELVFLERVISGAELGVRVTAYDFAADFKATAKPASLIVGLNTDASSAHFYADSGALDGSSRQEQVVVVQSKPESSSSSVWRIDVVRFGIDLAMTGAHVEVPVATTLVRAWGTAVGRFDPPDGANGDMDFNQQIAVLFTEDSVRFGPNTRVDIFTVDPASNDFTPTFKSAKIIESEILLADDHRPAAPLQAGDFQGRSLRLGPPEKITITSHIQPDTILGMPPMQVDFIQGLGGAPASVVNVTVFPQDFNVGYDFADTSKDEASRKSTTSYTMARKNEFNEDISFGIPDVFSIGLSAKQSTEHTHENTVEKTYNTYSGQSFKFSTQTVFDDKVAATASRLNIYSYPLIGHSACALESPNCPDDCAPGPSPCPKLPLHVQFSGPDNVVHLELTDARALEWYQPVGMPGNVFTNPGSLPQIAADQPQQQDQSGNTASRLQLLSPANTVWGSQTAETVSVNWTQGGGTDQSTDTVNTHSRDSSLSVSGKVDIKGLDIGGGAGFDSSKSNSTGTLNTSTASFSKSTGVTLNRGIDTDGPASNLDFLYEGESYIFGQSPPTGTLHTDIPLNADIRANGILTVGFAADPLSMGVIESGEWWRQAYSAAPDVALNHPQRWLQKLPTGFDDELVAFNCPIGFSSTVEEPECSANGQVANPLNVASALFYQMKGFFVTPGDSAEGPATNIATAGDTLTLRARIYNTSLVDMPAGTMVNVDFYAQPWDPIRGQFMSDPNNPAAFAPAVYIGRDPLGPIPGFCGGVMAGIDPCTVEDAPRNWVFAEKTWNTGTLDPLPSSETFWKFWVVVWMEQSGELVPEIPLHGLKAIPAAPLNSLADVLIETYANNLGFYNQTFALFAPSAPASANAAVSDESEVRIEGLEVSPDVLLRDELASVRAAFVTGPRAIDHVLARFFDGDPEDGGQSFDLEMIPRIPGDSQFTTVVPFQPRSCGLHEIFVEAVPMEGDAPPAIASTTVEVTIDVDATLSILIGTLGKFDMPHGIENSLAKKLANAQKSFGKGNDGAAMNQLDAFINEVIAQGGKKLSLGAADSLIARADGIIDCI